MRILARDIKSDDYIANLAIAEAAERLAEQYGKIKVMADLLSDCVAVIDFAIDYEDDLDECDKLDYLKLHCVNAIANADEDVVENQKEGDCELYSLCDDTDWNEKNI